MKKIFAFAAVGLLLSCSTSISTKVKTNYQRLAPEKEIVVLEKSDALPENSEFVGDVKIGDSGFTTDCGYNKVLSDAKSAARSAGANMLQIIELKKPTVLGSTCYRMKAKMYRNMNEESMAKIMAKRSEKNKSRLPADADYALIHFYRPTSGGGALLHYSIRDDNNSPIGKLHNGEKFVYKTTDFGSKTFYATLETKEVVAINVEKGQEYFVRCSVNMGIALGRPEINLVENHIGMQEYAEMK